MADLVKLTINGKKATVPKGTLLVEAAAQVGIEIPVFCYHKKLKPVGACRMCLVEITKNPRLQTACTTPVAEGMECSSVAPAAIAGQNGVIELLLANHPLDCPICDKGGECPLQDNTFKYGLGTSRMNEPKRHKDKAFALSEKIVLDKERCIMCYRCTRFQAEIPGDHALVALERGGESEIGTLDGEAFESPFSGNTIELCPVGALTSRFYRFRARPWDLAKTASVCSGCSVGCNVSLQARDGAILRVLSRDNPKVDDGWLCDRGRFETLPPLTHKAHCDDPPETRRPMQPLVRKDGKLLPATLDEALARAAELLRGKSSVLAAATTTNEAAALLAKQVRQLLPDARICFDAGTHSPWPVQGKIANLRSCTKIVNVGFDPWTELPVLALWQRKPLESGGRIVAIGSENGLSRDTAAWLKPDQGGLAEAGLLKEVEDLLAALEGRPASEAATAAALALQKDGPAAVLLGVEHARDAKVLDACKKLAGKIGANAETGLLGAPAAGPNARGAQELAPELVKLHPTTAPGDAVMTLGSVATPIASGCRRIVASWTRVEDTPDVEVVLPLAHPYEQQGTWTNLDGQVQQLVKSGSSVKHALADHVLLGKLVETLGGKSPQALETVVAPLAQIASTPALSER